MGATGAIGQYVGLVERNKADDLARRAQLSNSIASIGSGTANIVGDLMGENKRNAAIKAHLVDKFGVDPAEADNAIARGPDAVMELGQQAAARLRAQQAAGLLGFDATASMGPGMADKFMGVGGAAAAPPAPAPRPQGSFGGAEGGFGPTVTPAAAPPVPSAAMTMPSRAELLRRFMSTQTGDAGALTTALGFLPPEAKPMTDEDTAQAEESRARAALLTAQAGAVGQPKVDNKPEDQPLTAAQASLLGVDPQFVGKVTYGNAKDAMTVKQKAAEQGKDVDLATIFSAIDAISNGRTVAPGTKVPSNIGPGLVSLAGQRLRSKRPPVSDTTAEVLGIAKGTPVDEVKFVVDKMVNDAKSRALSPGETAALSDIRTKNLEFIQDRAPTAATKGPDGQLLYPDLQVLVNEAVEQNKKIDAVLMKKIGGPGLGDVPPPPGEQKADDEDFRNTLSIEGRAEYDALTTDADKKEYRRLMEGK